jgi:predicted nucleic acid-binding protein
VRRAVLADAGPLYAAVDRDDAHHRRAQSELKRLAREKKEVLVAYPTLFEA